MAHDRQILREVWDGRIPVCFTLAGDEVIGLEHPEPCYLMVPRLSYFPLVTDKVHRQFSRYIDPSIPAELWLECNGQPLKWHYPIGVLFDLYSTYSEEVQQLPWNLTVHFQNFPEQEIFHCSGKETVESHFMSMVKEADALKHKSTIISAMQKRDHKQLWSGLKNDKFDEFWAINRRLMDNSSEEPLRSIPYRLYQIDEPGFVQKLFKPLIEERQAVLEDLLLEIAPYILENNSLRVLIQGVEPSRETPLLWLSAHLSHPDNFLHLCIVPRPKTNKPL